ncbi:type II secretion system GspH family protein [Candidatus Saccharibacteria bacterium]|nr:type II secretion system GspH family protein [Candidatus Saccharibacteria bacterium]
MQKVKTQSAEGPLGATRKSQSSDSARPRHKKGFTIIEVVLVLAIAGLIFMMVFIALPALQRSQRDTQRRNDIARMQTAINNFQTNNRGRLPTDWDAFLENYLLIGGDQFEDPTGNPYQIVVGTANDVIPPFGDWQIQVITNAVCGPTEDTLDTNNQGVNKVAIRYDLEGGGSVCLNN